MTLELALLYVYLTILKDFYRWYPLGCYEVYYLSNSCITSCQ